MCGHEAPETRRPATSVQGMSGMARKTSTTSSLDSEVAKELENALDIDLFVDDEAGQLDVASSIADFEAQISRAAEDLARDTRPSPANRKPEAPVKAPQPAKAAQPTASRPAAPAPKPAARAASAPVNDLRPLEAPASAAPSSFSHANDDRQRDYRAMQQQIRRTGSSAIYWMTALLSVAWIAGVAVMGDMLFERSLLEVRSFSDLVATPQLLGLIIAIVLPVMLFWGFAVMIRRAQEMRLAAQSMAEVAFRLAEPEHLATDRVMLVGQAVRREVQAMGEGIERTLARAVELAFAG
jgi:hypothetical protein